MVKEEEGDEPAELNAWLDDTPMVANDLDAWREAVEAELAELHALEEGDGPTVYDTVSVASTVALTAAESTPVELYDSGASHHMSPYREQFTSFTETAPWSLNAANQQRFQSTGVGVMVVSVPNGSAPPSQIRLLQVLYTPALGFTLVSIGRIDDAGYTATFTGGKLTIANNDGMTVGTIPKSGGLYLVAHPREDGVANAATTVKKVTVMDLHRRLGHIVPRAIRELVAKGRAVGDTRAGRALPSSRRVFVM